MTSQALKNSLARHRNERAVDLHIRPPLERLLDADLCRMVEEDLMKCSSGDGWEIQQATPNLADSLPRRRGVYMFVWKPPFTFHVADPKPQHPFWYALYVGQAGGDGGKGTIHDRYKNEYRRHIQKHHEHLWQPAPPADRASRLSCFLCLEYLEYWFLLIDDAKQTRDLERRLIDLLSPPLNDRRGTLRVASKTRAF